MFAVGWNILGDQPDEDPKLFQNWAEAKHLLRREFIWLQNEVEELRVDANTAHIKLDNCFEGSVSFRIGPYIYWIERQVASLGTERET